MSFIMFSQNFANKCCVKLLNASLIYIVLQTIVIHSNNTLKNLQIKIFKISLYLSLFIFYSVKLAAILKLSVILNFGMTCTLYLFIQKILYAALLIIKLFLLLCVMFYMSNNKVCIILN